MLAVTALLYFLFNLFDTDHNKSKIVHMQRMPKPPVVALNQTQVRPKFINVLGKILICHNTSCKFQLLYLKHPKLLGFILFIYFFVVKTHQLNLPPCNNLFCARKEKVTKKESALQWHMWPSLKLIKQDPAPLIISWTGQLLCHCFLIISQRLAHCCEKENISTFVAGLLWNTKAKCLFLKKILGLVLTKRLMAEEMRVASHW